MSEIAVPKHECLRCGYVMDRVADVNNRSAVPKRGDITLCLNCGAVMELAADLTCTGIEPERVEMLRADPDFMREIQRVVRAIHFVQALHGRRN